MNIVNRKKELNTVKECELCGRHAINVQTHIPTKCNQHTSKQKMKLKMFRTKIGPQNHTHTFLLFTKFKLQSE